MIKLSFRYIFYFEMLVTSACFAHETLQCFKFKAHTDTGREIREIAIAIARNPFVCVYVTLTLRGGEENKKKSQVEGFSEGKFMLATLP